MRKIHSLGVFATLLVLLASCASQQPPPAPEPAVEVPGPAPKLEVEPRAPAPVPEPEAAQVERAYQGSLILDGAGSYTVREGDTLSEIAEACYGSGMYFPLIALASDDIVFDVDLIFPGQVFPVPDLERNMADPGARVQLKRYFGEVADLYERRGRPAYAEAIRAVVAGW